MDFEHDDAGYTYVTLEDGTKKRIAHVQTGGAATVEQIDTSFANTDVCMGLVWNNDKQQWSWSHEDWYDFLDITPDYLKAKCHDNGINNVDGVLDIWSTLLYRKRSSRGITPEENIVTKRVDPLVGQPVARQYIKDLGADELGPILKYQNTVIKDTERDAYQKCALDFNSERSEVKERSMCQSMIGRPDVEDSDGGMLVKKTMTRMSDYDTVSESMLSQEEKRKYERCRELGELSPEELQLDGQPFGMEAFTHIYNDGRGDCLFVATSNYIDLASRIGEKLGASGPIYPKVNADQSEINAAFDADPTPIRTLSKVKGGTAMLRTRADALRQQVCDYFLAHAKSADLYMPLDQTLAKAYLEENIDSSMRSVYNSYVETLVNNPWNLEVIPEDVKIDNSPQLKHALKILESEPVQGDNSQEELHAWSALVTKLFESYVQNMRKMSTYGGQSEIAAVSKVIGKKIAVMQWDDEGYVSHMGFNSPDSDDIIYIFLDRAVGTGVGAHYTIVVPIADKYLVTDALDTTGIEMAITVKAGLSSVPEEEECHEDNLDYTGLDAFLADQCGVSDPITDVDDRYNTLDGCSDVWNIGYDLLESYFKNKVYDLYHNDIADIFYEKMLILLDEDTERIDDIRILIYHALFDKIERKVGECNILDKIVDLVDEPSAGGVMAVYRQLFDILGDDMQQELLDSLEIITDDDQDDEDAVTKHYIYDILRNWSAPASKPDLVAFLTGQCGVTDPLTTIEEIYMAMAMCSTTWEDALELNVVKAYFNNNLHNLDNADLTDILYNSLVSKFSSVDAAAIQPLIYVALRDSTVTNGLDREMSVGSKENSSKLKIYMKLFSILSEADKEKLLKELVIRAIKDTEDLTDLVTAGRTPDNYHVEDEAKYTAYGLMLEPIYKLRASYQANTDMFGVDMSAYNVTNAFLQLYQISTGSDILEYEEADIPGIMRALKAVVDEVYQINTDYIPLLEAVKFHLTRLYLELYPLYVLVEGRIDPVPVLTDFKDVCDMMIELDQYVDLIGDMSEQQGGSMPDLLKWQGSNTPENKSQDDETATAYLQNV